MMCVRIPTSLLSCRSRSLAHIMSTAYTVQTEMSMHSTTGLCLIWPSNVRSAKLTGLGGIKYCPVKDVRWLQLHAK